MGKSIRDYGDTRGFLGALAVVEDTEQGFDKLSAGVGRCRNLLVWHSSLNHVWRDKTWALELNESVQPHARIDCLHTGFATVLYAYLHHKRACLNVLCMLQGTRTI